MKKWAFRGLGGGSLLGLAVLAFVLLTPRGARPAEPEWDGRPLAYWIGLLREVPKDVRMASTDWRKAEWAVGKIGVTAIPALVATLDDPSPEVRLRAIRPMVAMGTAAADAAPALVVHLRDADIRVRQWSAVALGTIGPPAVGSLGALVQALKDPEAPVRQAAAAALGSLGSEDALPALEEALQDPSPAVQKAARLSQERIKAPKP